MSQAKRQLEEEQEQREVTVDLLIKAGVLKRCESHEEVVFSTGEGELETAYKMGNAGWSSYSQTFKSRRDMTDKILAMSTDVDYANDKCEQCESRYQRD